MLTWHKRTATELCLRHVTVWPWATAWPGLSIVANHATKIFQYCPCFFESPSYIISTFFNIDIYFQRWRKPWGEAINRFGSQYAIGCITFLELLIRLWWNIQCYKLIFCSILLFFRQVLWMKKGIAKQRLFFWKWATFSKSRYEVLCVICLWFCGDKLITY
jgi:hypothetical protein